MEARAKIPQIPDNLLFSVDIPQAFAFFFISNCFEFKHGKLFSYN
jgi:hypothetical protein